MSPIDISELQKRLDGAFDLDRVEDCKKVIESLLRSVGERDGTISDLHCKLRSLALSVTTNDIRSKDKANEITLRRHTDNLSNLVASVSEASGMTNQQLIDEVSRIVLTSYDVSSRESALLGELIFRTKNGSSF